MECDRTGLHDEVVFTHYSALSDSGEVMRRLLSPLAGEMLRQRARAAGQTLASQSVDLRQERFTVYVPRQPPLHGYALLVFIAPGPNPGLPRGWGPVLDRFGMIYVSAGRSGNDTSVIGRREPLALLAVANVASEYRIDAQRVFVGGFSGGSRVALRVALGYPDVFRGAILDAGADPLGKGGFPPPPAQLLALDQAASRLVFVTGSEDALHVQQAADSMRSLQHWCIGNVEAQTAPGGHTIANPAMLAHAMEFLLQPTDYPQAALDACRARVGHELQAALQSTRASIAANAHGPARRGILTLDADFGGAAQPDLVELARACACGLLN